jgi:hypothetical protein
MIRNAEMERQMALVGSPSAAAFEQSIYAEKIDSVIASAKLAERTMTVLSRAAGYNPRAPLGKA